jgi:hypothetical protein
MQEKATEHVYPRYPDKAGLSGGVPSLFLLIISHQFSLSILIINAPITIWISL